MRSNSDRGHISAKDSGSHFKICSAFGVSTDPVYGSNANMTSSNRRGWRHTDSLFYVSELSLKYSSLMSLSPQ